MEATLDRFGRIVIPKKIREDLHLQVGSSIRIEEGEGEIVLKPVEGEPSLVKKDGVLVFSGKAVGSVETAVEEHRQERNKLLRGGK
jgi:AbrB family looped-hinge helix DNA binding protein